MCGCGWVFFGGGGGRHTPGAPNYPEPAQAQGLHTSLLFSYVSWRCPFLKNKLLVLELLHTCKQGEPGCFPSPAMIYILGLFGPIIFQPVARKVREGKNVSDIHNVCMFNLYTTSTPKGAEDSLPYLAQSEISHAVQVKMIPQVFILNH